MGKQSGRRYSFSAYTFNTETGELARGGRRLHIPDQAARLLAALLENPGAMLSREELKSILWPDGEVLDYDRSINRTISQLRGILRDHSSKSSILIETLPKRGYRFAGQVKEALPESAAPAPFELIEAESVLAEPIAYSALAPVVLALQPEAASVAAPVPRSRSRWSGWRVRLAVVGLGCLVLTAVGTYILRPRPITALTLGIAAFETDGDGAQALADSFRLNLADVLAQSPQIETRSVHAFDHLGPDENAVLNRAHQLGVDLLLFGKFRLRDNQCELRLELVRTRDGAHLSSFQYSGSPEELAAITDHVERDLFERLRPGDKRAAMQFGRPKNTAAYAAYLHGRTLLSAWTDDSLLQAVSAFQEALRLDPGYARAYAGLASTYFVLSQHGAGNASQYLEKTRQAATQALGLDPGLPEAHAMLGQVLVQKDWNFPAAETQLDRAVELDPHHAMYRQWLSIIYGEEGHFQQALDQIDKAHAADPGWAPLYMTEIYLAGSSRQYERAERATASLLAKMPNWPLAHEQTGSLYWQEGKFQSAVAEWRRAAELEKNADRMKLEDDGAIALRNGGVRAYAKLRLAAIFSGKGVSHADEDFDLAEWYAYAGQYDQALQELDQQVSTRAGTALQISTNSAFDPLHGNPRYQALIRRIGTMSAPDL
jgi:DNA-binding winged helix-turn-helix (wHTH) protein/tetratricopeptide (TPR) repeat protein/TolB-like protein